MSPTGRGTDPLDHLRLQCSEGNVVSASVAKAAIEFVQERIAELERKAKAFDLIASEAVLVDYRDNLCDVKEKFIVFADNGSITGDDLLTAIEAATALEAKETK